MKLCCEVIQLWDMGVSEAAMLCAIWKSDGFISKRIIYFKGMKKKCISDLLSRRILWHLLFFYLLLHIHEQARQTLAYHRCLRTINRVHLLRFILKRHMQKKSTSAYGAHFCTSGLMLLSSFFVLSIIVLKERGIQSRAVCVCVCMLLFHNKKWNTAAIVFVTS